jgi:hypothetical protein
VREMENKIKHYMFVFESPGNISYTTGWLESIDDLLDGLEDLYSGLPKDILNFKNGNLGKGVKLSITVNDGTKGIKFRVRDARINKIKELLKEGE